MSDCGTSSVLKSLSWEAIVSTVSLLFIAHGPFLYSCWFLSKLRCTEPLTASYPTARTRGWPGAHPRVAPGLWQPVAPATWPAGGGRRRGPAGSRPPPQPDGPERAPAATHL